MSRQLSGLVQYDLSFVGMKTQQRLYNGYGMPEDIMGYGNHGLDGYGEYNQRPLNWGISNPAMIRGRGGVSRRDGWTPPDWIPNEDVWNPQNFAGRISDQCASTWFM